jgi:SAM-dependent methyltransferase
MRYPKNLRKKYIQDSNNLSYSGSTNLTISEMGLKEYNNYIVKKINEYPHTSATRFLEFGAGRGTLTDIFSNVLNVKIDTVEIDPALVKILQKKGYRVYQDLTELKSEYDFIYTSNVLEHIVEDDHTLDNMLKVLNKKIGVFVIHVPAFPILYSNLDLSLGHVRRYTKKELKYKLENAGWNVVDIYFDDSLGFFVSFLLKFFGLSRDAGKVKVSSLVIYDKVIFPLSRIIDKLGVKYFFGKNLIAVARPKLRKEEI